MSKHLRRSAVVAVTTGIIAGGAAVALSGPTPSWQPVTSGLSATPEQLLPTTVSPTQPVRVVSTALDADGRPVVTATTATDTQAAAALVKKGQKAENAIGVEVDAPITALAAPAGDDEFRAQQWNLTKIRAAAAWEKSTGSGVTVAVIDTGVDATHADLAGQVLPGIDMVTGATGASTDPNGHGTHVAGTIAALTGNTTGISAVAPDAKILPVRVMDATGAGYMSSAAAGVVWATDNGAKVINLSFGSITRSYAMTSAIEYARSEGVTVVAAAGNDRALNSPVSYPAAEPGVIAVGATDLNDNYAVYSNQGSYLDVSAPGSSILSTAPGDEYATMYGTSMAAPHVSALAALLASQHSDMDPDLIEYAIESSAVDRGSKGWDKDFGSGRIDAVAALAAADVYTGTPAPTPTSASPSASSASPTSSPSRTVTPTPTRTVAKIRPVITGGGKVSVIYGGNVTTTFTVTLGSKKLANGAAQACIATPTTAFACTDVTTNGDGKVVITRPATGSFQALVSLAETDKALAGTSPVAGYTVKAKLTVAKAGAGQLSIAITGAAGQVVQVQRQDKKGWVMVAAYRAEDTRVVGGLVKGQRYRVVLPDTAAVVGMTSLAITM